MKKFISVVMTIILLFTILPLSNFMQVGLPGNLTVKAATLTLSQLRAKFPNGKYWNHAGNPGASNSVNNQDGYTSTPCSKHGVVGTSEQTCNGFAPNGTQLSWQCMGYAEKLGYDATGYNPRNNANGWYTYTSSSALDNLKPGDIVRYKNNGHSIYVTGVSGDTVTFTDCNSDGHCIIKWDKTISKSTLKSTFTHVRSAPSTISDAKTLKVFFNANGGSISSDDYKLSSDVVYNKSDNTKYYQKWIYNNTKENGLVNDSTLGIYRTGYTFTGWGTKSSGGTVFDQGDNTLKPTDINPDVKNGDCTTTLYAQWRKNILTVSFDANGGSISSDTYKLSSNLIYNKSDSSKTTQIWNYGVAKDNGLMNDTTFGIYKTGYYFSGWGTKSSGGTVFDQGDNTLTAVNINSNIKDGDCSSTLYAQWTPNVLTVYFNANGGSVLSDTFKLTSNLIYNKSDGTKATQIWNYGKAKENGLMNDTTFGIYRTGYTFSGWGTKSSGGTVFDQGDSTLTAVDINSNVKNGNCSSTLYAQWTAKKYTVTFNANGGSCSTVNKSVTYDSTYGTLPTAIRTGYVFNGWYTAASGGTKIAADTNVAITANQTLYAQWSQVALSSISVKTNPSDVSYCVGETLNTSGLTLIAKYSDGSTKTISNGFTCSPTTLNTVGTQKITVTYSGKTTLFDVTVNAHSQKTATTNATCEAAGKTVVTCTVCGKKISETTVPAKGHSYSSVVTPPTATEQGYTTYTCSICGDKYISDYVPAIGGESFNCKGTVVSSSSTDNSVKIEFIPEGDVKPAYTKSVNGTDVEFTLNDVISGNYTIRVSKEDHVTREYSVTVNSDTDVALKLHLVGDLNGDGKVNTMDVARANASAKGTSSLSGYEFACADINGDGKVNTMDVARMNAHAKSVSTLW